MKFKRINGETMDVNLANRFIIGISQSRTTGVVLGRSHIEGYFVLYPSDSDYNGLILINDFEEINIDSLEFKFVKDIVMPVYFTNRLGEMIHDTNGEKGIIFGRTKKGTLAVLYEDNSLLHETEDLGMYATYHNKVNEVYNSGICSDYTIVHKGKKYNVHKYVLITNSDYYATKFNGKWNENTDELPNVDNEILEIVLRYMYFHEFVKTSLDKLSQIKIIADFLQIGCLLQIVNEHIRLHSIDKYNYMIFFDDCHLCTHKEEEIVKLIGEHTEVYNYLSKNNPMLKEDIIQYMLKKLNDK